MEIFSSVGQFLEMRDMYPPRVSIRVSPHLPAGSQKFKEPVINPSLSSLPCRFSKNSKNRSSTRVSPHFPAGSQKIQRTGLGMINHGSQKHETVKEPVIRPSPSLLTSGSQIFKEPVLVYNHGSQKHETVKEQAEVRTAFS